MAENANIMAFELSKALPNKLLNSDGSITDFQGNIITPANEINAEVYKKSKALANKFLVKSNNTETTTETYSEISFKMFILVDKLPKEGKENKIYLVPSDDGMFDEYFWNTNNKWDKIGEVHVDMTNYPTKEEVSSAIAANSVSDREYMDSKIKENITNVLGGTF